MIGKDAINRLETMVLMDGIDISVNAIREYVNDALDIVVHISRMKDGKRKITEISEVVDVKNNEIVLKNIFKFKNDGVTEAGAVKGEFILQEYIPEVLAKIKNTGINDVDDIFSFKKSKKNK